MMRTLGTLRLPQTGLLSALALAGALLASSPAAAACDVQNMRSSAHHTSLQAAVSAATAGDKLKVTGTCVGSTTIDRNLVIRGALVPSAGRSILDGGRAGRVLQIASGVTVHLKGLVIRRGSVSGEFGGGILNHGTLKLTNVAVVRNQADSGGGIYSTGNVVVNGTTSVRRNRATVDDGGGIYVDGASLIVNHSTSVHHNRSGRGGGGIYGVSATLTLNGSTAVYGNRATTGGGGIYVDFWSTLFLNGSTAVHHNVAEENGGGVFDGSIMTMNDSSSIEDNTAGGRGGGIYIGCGALLTGADAGGNVLHNVHGNLAKEMGCP